MAIEAREAAMMIVASANEAAAEQAAVAGPGGMAAGPGPGDIQALAVSPDTFCKLWKNAKPALTAAATILTFIAPQIAGVLRGLIKLGDQLASEICG